MSEPLDEVLAENAAERDGLRKMVADLESKLAAGALDGLPLFARGEELKHEGMERADAAEPDFWKDRADQAIRALAAEGREFTAEDVRHLAGSPTHPNAFGSRFLSAAKRGVIRKVGYRNSTRASLHAHPIAVWLGN